MKTSIPNRWRSLKSRRAFWLAASISLVILVLAFVYRSLPVTVLRWSNHCRDWSMVYGQWRPVEWSIDYLNHAIKDQSKLPAIGRNAISLELLPDRTYRWRLDDMDKASLYEFLPRVAPEGEFRQSPFGRGCRICLGEPSTIEFDCVIMGDGSSGLLYSFSPDHDSMDYLVLVPVR